MPHGIHLSLRASVLALPLLVVDMAPLHGQDRDARIPEPGRLWLEMSPTLLDWSEQFAADPSDASLADGDREPLSADFDGPIAARLFPGPEPYLADLNADAAAFGFDPVTASGLSFGDLDFSSFAAQVRRLQVGFELGVIERIALGVRAPFTMTDVELAFAYDTAAATVTFADRAFPPGSAFFTDARAALTDLESLIAGGTLAGTELADAIALRDQTDAFLTALEGRAMSGGLIPTGPSGAGMQMSGRFDGFVAEFDSLGLVLPGLALPETAAGADLAALFEGEPLVAFPPGGIENALNLGEIELSARLGLLDQISAREREDASAAEREPAAEEPAAEEDPAAEAGPPAEQPEAADPAAGAETAVPGSEGRPTLRLRTTVGATLRIPIRQASFPPLQNAAHFFDVPIADGQMDIELALYQDVALAGWLLLRSSLRYGIQRPDEVILRVAPPDRPYAFQSLQTVVRRDPGDYLALLVRPGLRLNRVLTVGLEYDYYRLEHPTYALTESLAEVPDASPLEVEGSQSRHRLGFGFVYDLSEARGREAIVRDGRSAGPPWQFAFSFRRAVSGSGGQTPASFRVQAHFRVPTRIF